MVQSTPAKNSYLDIGKTERTSQTDLQSMVAALELEEHMVIAGDPADHVSRHVNRVIQLTSSHSQQRTREQGQALKQHWNSTQKHQAGTLRF